MSYEIRLPVSIAILFITLAGCSPSATKTIEGNRLAADVDPYAELLAIDDPQLREILAFTEPYVAPDGPQETVPKEKRLLYNLKKLLDEDLASQSGKYKNAVRKIILRHAANINPMIDSIQVAVDYRDGQKYWNIAGDTRYENWRDYGSLRYSIPATTFKFLTLRKGKIEKFDFETDIGACGGLFSDCCTCSVEPPIFDDSLLSLLITVDRAGDFRVPYSQITSRGVKRLAESGSLYSISFNGTSLSDDDLRSLSRQTQLREIELGGPGWVPEIKTSCDGSGFKFLHGLKKLRKIVLRPESGQIADEFYDALPYFKELDTVVLSTGRISRRQVEKLVLCRELKEIHLNHCVPESADVFEPLNSLKLLRRLVVSVGGDDDVLRGHTISFHDFPLLELLEFHVSGYCDVFLSPAGVPRLSTIRTNVRLANEAND